MARDGEVRGEEEEELGGSVNACQYYLLQEVMFGSFYPHEVAELFRTEVEDLEVGGEGGEERGKGSPFCLRWS